MFPFASTPAAPQAQRAAPLAGAPGLRDAAERLVTFLVKALQTMAGDHTTVEGYVSGIASMPLRDVVAAHRAETVAATIQCGSPASTLLVTLDAVLVHALVELLTGGRGGDPAPQKARAATAIDAQFTQILPTLIAAGMEKEWGANGFGAARAQRQEGLLANDCCGARVTNVGTVTIALTIFGLRGTAMLALPPAALDAFPQAEAPIKEKVVDAAWSEGLRRELQLAPIRVEAFLEANPLPLGAIAGLAIGDVIALPPTARGRASLVCDDRPVYLGELGLDDAARFCVRVDEAVAPPADRMGAQQGATRGHSPSRSSAEARS